MSNYLWNGNPVSHEALSIRISDRSSPGFLIPYLHSSISPKRKLQSQADEKKPIWRVSKGKKPVLGSTITFSNIPSTSIETVPSSQLTPSTPQATAWSNFSSPPPSATSPTTRQPGWTSGAPPAKYGNDVSPASPLVAKPVVSSPTSVFPPHIPLSLLSHPPTIVSFPFPLSSPSPFHYPLSHQPSPNQKRGHRCRLHYGQKANHTKAPTKNSTS